MTTVDDAQTRGATRAPVRAFSADGDSIAVSARDAEPERLLETAKRAGGFVWIDLHDPDAAELAPYAAALDLHPLPVDEAASGDQQPTLQSFGDQAYVVFWSPSDSGTSSAETPKLFLFLGERFVLTVRRNTWMHELDLHGRFDAGRDYLRDGPVGALYVALAAVSENYSRIVNGIERELEELEREVFDEAVVDDAARIYRLRQRIGRLRRPLTSLVDALTRDAGDLAKIGDRYPRLAPYLSDAVDDLVGVGELAADQSTSLDTVVSSHENNVAQRQNSDMRRISAYGALLAVPTVVAGLYGMNFQNLPGVDWDLGWLIVLGSIVALDVGFFVNFKRQGWL